MESGSVVIITGASTGFGRATAKRLAGAGMRVFGTSRQAPPTDSPAPARPEPGTVTLLRLDVRDDASVRDCVAAVIDRAGRIDALVNNAGFSLCGAIEENSIPEVENLFQTNYFGAVRMIRAVLPHMRARGTGRIVNVTSLAGLLSVPFHGHYSAAKFALEGLSEALRMEVARFGIHVSVVEPSDFRTEGTQARVFPAGPIDAYETARARAVDIMIRSEQGAPGPEPVARLIEKILCERRPRLRYRVGKDAMWAPALRPFLPASVYEWAMRRNFRVDDPV
jgi:NAD(P)-dependent dehydrogenase (short-subunit alcohol dehydrogenase family)